MSTTVGVDLEQLLRRLIREEVGRCLGVEPEAIEDADESDLRQLVAERAAKLRRSRTVRP